MCTSRDSSRATVSDMRQVRQAYIRKEGYDMSAAKINVRIPQPSDIGAAIRLYYQKTELSTSDIITLFGGILPFMPGITTSSSFFMPKFFNKSILCFKCSLL